MITAAPDTQTHRLRHHRGLSFESPTESSWGLRALSTESTADWTNWSKVSWSAWSSARIAAASSEVSWRPSCDRPSVVASSFLKSCRSNASLSDRLTTVSAVRARVCAVLSPVQGNVVSVRPKGCELPPGRKRHEQARSSPGRSRAARHLPRGGARIGKTRLAPPSSSK